MTAARRSRRWDEVLPQRFEWELAEMERVAPELKWQPDKRTWRGTAPVWPFERAAPEHLDEFVGDDRFEIAIEPSAAHPAVPPRIWPINPAPEIEHCTDAAWHTLGDGSLCVVREYYTWSGEESCAALVPTAAGWFLEYLLMTAGRIPAMTVQGIEINTDLDELFIQENRVPQQ